ncbi:hypothetical protein BT93_F2276 [Corymbia citriodora subsp. variegata]|nr:hypothetical protein BT93_F2276 [Corymbia citriodora subsp. variegata]
MYEDCVSKVKDLEVELETTRYNCKENVQQATLIEKERFTQMQWDMEELRSKCLEVEMNLKAEQEEKARVESAKLLVIQERDFLLNELDVAREHLCKLHKRNKELEAKSKADVKLLVKEVKSLRSSQSELKQELGRLMKEKREVEAQLLAQDVENAVVRVDETRNASDGNGRTSDDELRKMLTDMFIDYATLRKQANSVIRCALNMYVQAEEKDEDDEEVPL